MKFRITTSICVIIIFFTNSLNAKDPFVPAIQVDGMVITHYEISQRSAFFELLNFPGNHKKQAEKSLIDDKLKIRAAEQFGIELKPKALEHEMKVFAERANLTVDQFAKRLNNAGVDTNTWKNYMQIPILWFETVNRKFASQISSLMSDNNIEEKSTTGSDIQVLLTEIIIPVQSGFEEEAKSRVQDLRKIKSFERFSEAAFKYSVAPTREVGGKVKWQNLSDLPLVVRPLIAGLSLGEVSEPLPIPGGLAIFQLRDLKEGKLTKFNPTFTDYAEFIFDKNKKIKNLLISNVMTCDDLYSFLKSTKNSELTRENTKTGSLSKNVRTTLSDLDQNEFTFIESDSGKSKLIMVCGRSEQEAISKNDLIQINRSIANKHLLSLANSYLENLRQEARIVFK